MSEIAEKTRSQEECLSLIDETVQYYSENPRGMTLNLTHDAFSCTYYDNITGNMCAVGRCLSEPKKFSDSRMSAGTIIRINGDLIFKDTYQNYPKPLWEELQVLHDCEINWDGQELTERGKVIVKELKNKTWI